VNRLSFYGGIFWDVVGVLIGIIRKGYFLQQILRINRPELDAWKMDQLTVRIWMEPQRAVHLTSIQGGAPSVLSWFVSHLTSSVVFPINWSYFNQLGLHRSPINLMNSLYINHLQITCFSGDWLNHLRQLRKPWSGLAATDGPFEVPKNQLWFHHEKCDLRQQNCKIRDWTNKDDDSMG